jgi:SAM-dependent methyltransferase
VSFRTFIKERMPWPVRLMSRRLRRLPADMKNMQRSTKEVFTEIYAENIWGGRKPHADEDFPFYSGPGSEEKAAHPYADCVNAFIAARGVQTVVDLGCGDFRIGSRIARPPLRYIGIDIVEPLIKANQERFANDFVEFHCLDIITGELPAGDLCLLREVLQHLSNAKIATILPKLKAFKWVIITEEQPGPSGSFKPNKDRPHGEESRSIWNSGVVLTAPPFNIPNVTPLLEVPLPHGERQMGECLSSVLMSNT